MGLESLRKHIQELKERGILGSGYENPGADAYQPTNPSPVVPYNPPEVAVPISTNTQAAKTTPVSSVKPVVPTASTAKADPKSGQNGLKAFTDITSKCPQFGETGIGNTDLIDAYNAGLNGTDLSRETRDNAAAGGYLDSIEAMFNAGLQDASMSKYVDDFDQENVDNTKNLSYTAGNTAGSTIEDTVEPVEHTYTANRYGVSNANNTNNSNTNFQTDHNFARYGQGEAPRNNSTPNKTTQDLLGDLEYLKDMLYLNGAANSSIPSVQALYQKITNPNYNASKETSVNEIYETFYDFMKGVTNDQIAKSNKIAVGTNKNMLFDEIYDKTMTSPNFENVKDSDTNSQLGQAGTTALGEISNSSPEVFVNNRKNLNDAYKDGLDGKALSQVTQSEAKEGGYLDEILRIYQAGQTDGKIKAGDKDIDKLENLWHIKHDPSPWEKDYEYLSYVLTHCGAKNSKDPNVQAAYKYFMNQNNQGEQIPQDILNSTLSFANTIDEEWIKSIAYQVFGDKNYDVENIVTRNNFFGYPTDGGHITQAYHGEGNNGGGIDIGGLDVGDPVYAVEDGTVEYYVYYIKRGDDAYYCSYGVCAKLIIPGTDGKNYYLYAHLDPESMFENGLIYSSDWLKIMKTMNLIQPRDYDKNERKTFTVGSMTIKKGQIIGYLGQSGNARKGRHLHFGYFEDGTCKNIFEEDFPIY